MLIGHTGHQCEVVLADVESVVGEVLPLIEDVVADGAAETQVVVYERGDVELVVEGLGVGVSRTESQTGCEGQTLDGGEVCISSTSDIESVTSRISLVTLENRMVDQGVAAEGGDTVDVAVRIPHEV